MAQHLFKAALAAASLALAAPASAATLLVDGSGELTGATGVDVAGVLYDVTFLDGTCAAVFSGCNEPADFAFNSTIQTNVAAQALLDQVFLDGPLGQFDSMTALTRGCEHSDLCFVFIPHDSSGNGVIAANTSGSDTPSTFSGYAGVDLTGAETHTWARFTLPAAVPEPATWVMLLLGFGLVGGAMRSARRRQDEATAGFA